MALNRLPGSTQHGDRSVDELGATRVLLSIIPAWGVRVAGVVGMVIGAAWLLAWSWGLALRWSAAGAITVKTNMALGQLLAGMALLLLATTKTRSARRAVGLAAASLVLLIGALTLSEYLFHHDLGIDQLLAVEPPGAVATVSPNRMGLPGSSSLVLLGVGLLALASRRRFMAPYLGLGACFINLLPAVGFIYGVDEFYRLPRTGIAWPTVVAMMSLGIGIVLAHSDGGPMALLLRKDPGGMLLRRLLPAMLLIPLVLGFVRVQGERRGLYDTASGTGIFVLAMVLLFSVLLWRSAEHLSRTAAEQAEAVRARQESSERYHSLFANMLEGCAYCKMLFDGEGRPVDFVYLDVNSAFGRLTGLEDVVGKKASEVIPGLRQSHAELFDIYGRVALTGQPEKFEIELKPLGICFSVAAYSREKGNFVAVFDNITKRKHLEQELTRLASFPKLNPYPIAELDLAGSICYLNPAARRLFPDLEQKRLDHPWLAEWESVVRDATCDSETKIHSRDISLGDADYLQTIFYVPNTKRIRIYGLDITERKRTQQALMRSEQLASVGRLAATIAHEINNPLGAATNYLFLVSGDTTLPERLRNYVAQAQGELKRIAQISKTTLGFYRENTASTTISAAALLDDVLNLLGRKIEQKQITIQRHYDEAVPPITGHSGELRQVFSNLIANSIDALPQGGIINVRVNVRASNATVFGHDGDRKVQITICDNGHGIPPDVLPHIFEPFFTANKETGTGLGLWISKQIIEKHGGTVRVRSRYGGKDSGTMFSVVLSATADYKSEQMSTAS